MNGYKIELHPGFRFHPTDEELISHYLAPKVLDARFRALAMGEADLNKVEPWDLPRMAKIGEEEWYFFCVRDKKYPTGMRTNRATESGYWKATGKDKEIFRGKSLIGMKKTLVFYRGRAPRGIKTNWVIHEYRLEGKYSKNNLPKTAKNEWVISRLFNKTSSGKKTHISALTGRGDDLQQALQEEPNLPSLTEASAFEIKSTARISPPANLIDFSATNGNNQTPSSSLTSYPDVLHFSDAYLAQDQSILKLLMDGNDLSSSFAARSMADLSEDGPIDLDSLLNY